LSKIVGIYDDGANRIEPSIEGIAIKGKFMDLVAAIRRGEVDDAIIEGSSNIDFSTIKPV
jgi:hypothetical protein